MKKIFKLILIISLLTLIQIKGAISLVYNMRIAESTGQLIPGQALPYIFTFNPTYAYGQTRNGDKTNFIGLLQTSAYATPSFFIKVDFAFGESMEAIPLPGCSCKKYSHTKSFATDDLLIKAGYSYAPNEQIKLSFSGQFGIPTHQDFVLQFFSIGYGHIGLGFQVDGRFIYSIPQQSAINCAFRLIQFIPRKAISTINGIHKQYNINLGTLIDILITNQSIFGPHTFEFGYDQIFLCNGHIHPFLQGALEEFNFIRAAFFGIYKYILSTERINHIFIVGVSPGLDFWPWKAGNKIFVEPWVSYIINF